MFNVKSYNCFSAMCSVPVMRGNVNIYHRRVVTCVAGDLVRFETDVKTTSGHGCPAISRCGRARSICERVLPRWGKTSDPARTNQVRTRNLYLLL